MHARCDPFATINCDNDYDINEQKVMNNQDGSVDNMSKHRKTVLDWKTLILPFEKTS